MVSKVADEPQPLAPSGTKGWGSAGESWAGLGEAVSRTDLIADVMKRSILDGTLAPGEHLTERDVAGRLGVSKTPVRDAFKLLRLTGLVEVTSFQRVRVRRIDAELISELYQARHLIEPLAVGLAVDVRGGQPNPVARHALEDSQAANHASDMASVSLANRRFHRELYQACPNRFLLQQLDQLQDLTSLSATVGWRHSESSSREAVQHEAILGAFETGDRDETVRLLAAHIHDAAEVLLEAVAQNTDHES